MREKEAEEHRKAQEDIDRQIREEEEDRKKADDEKLREEQERKRKDKEEEAEKRRKGREDRLKKREEQRGDGFPESMFDEPDNILEEVEASEDLVTTVTSTTTQVMTTTTTQVITTSTPSTDGFSEQLMDLEDDINPKQVITKDSPFFSSFLSFFYVWPIILAVGAWLV